MAQLPLTHPDHRRLVRLVAERAGILTPLQRETLLDSAGLAMFKTWLNFDTDARTFASQLVRVLQAHGTLADTGQPALVALLRELREIVAGHEAERDFLDTLLAPYTRAGVPEPALTPSPSAAFIAGFAAHLCGDPNVQACSLPECAAFDWVGLRATTGQVDVVGLVDATGFTEGQVMERRQRFFALTRRLPRTYMPTLTLRNPNGLLCFVFAAEIPAALRRLIPAQAQVDHAATQGAVMVSWAVSLAGRELLTHHNPVSVLPPVILTAQSRFPSPQALQRFLNAFEPAPEAAATKPSPPQTTVPSTLADPKTDARSPRSDTASLRVLFLAANPPDTVRLRLDQEARTIEERLREGRGRDGFALHQAWAVRDSDLARLLLEHRSHIVHFAGHGSEAGALVLEDAGGRARPIPALDLAVLFGLLRDELRAVVLNACWAEGAAGALVEAGVPCVIGTTQSISDRAAITFAAGFYRGLGFGRSVREAVELGRQELGMEASAEGDTPRLLCGGDVDAATFIL